MVFGDYKTLQLELLLLRRHHVQVVRRRRAVTTFGVFLTWMVSG
jgi:hypothetical protein